MNKVTHIAESNMVPRAINHFLEDTCLLRDTKSHNVNALVGIMVEDQNVMALWPHAENFSLKSFVTNDENVSVSFCCARLQGCDVKAG